MRQTEFLSKAGDPKTLTVCQLMQDAVFTCGPRMDCLTVSRLMTRHHFGSLPVVDEHRTLLGLVTEYDLLGLMIAGRELGKVPVEQVMSTPVLTVTEDKSLVEVADLFQDRYVTRVPVVRGKQLVGIVARRDLLFGYLQASAYWS
ncbi:MAG TPA: CBS domain-containing protein [Nitrospiraceae bacterium]|nr:CBS domain-containing protein [Nitrospiraceae bacterium]